MLTVCSTRACAMTGTVHGGELYVLLSHREQTTENAYSAMVQYVRVFLGMCKRVNLYNMYCTQGLHVQNIMYITQTTEHIQYV